MLIENIDTIYSDIFTKKHRFHWVRKETKNGKIKENR
nr:MAG TPA: hypothetical protein [Bacteriophage sp.]